MKASCKDSGQGKFQNVADQVICVDCGADNADADDDDDGDGDWDAGADDAGADDVNDHGRYGNDAREKLAAAGVRTDVCRVEE